MKAHVVVSLKKEVLDPQGDAVRRALESMGVKGLRSVRIGKHIEIDIDENDAARLEHQLQSMSQKLLCNPVIEDFQIVIPDSES